MKGLSHATYLRVIAAHMVNAEPDDAATCPRFIRHARERQPGRLWWLPWLCGAALFAAILWGVT